MALAAFLARHAPELPSADGQAWLEAIPARREAVARDLGAPLPARPPQFCIGCPERPVFAALKLLQQDIGRLHIAADIGCHSFASFEPFNSGHTILGYGMSLASRAGVSPMIERRTLAIMGDGGFWHNGLVSGVQSALFNGDDAVLVIMKNGYTSATGTQEIISTPDEERRAAAVDKSRSLVHTNQSIERTLKGIGVKWLRVVDSYRVDEMRATLDEAFTTDFAGLKVIVAEGECQLERQRRDQAVARRSRQGGGADSARQVWRRRGCLFGRPLVHPAFRLPDALAEGEPRSAAPGSGRDRAGRLRRLRPVRRERARGGAVPVVLSRRGDPQSELARPARRAPAARRDQHVPADMTMSAAGPSQGANGSPSGGSAGGRIGQ